jgi:putative endonuclease
MAEVEGSSPSVSTRFMAYVYILRSLSQGRFYIGSTQDMAVRLRAHNSGAVLSTKAYRPWEKVFCQEVGTFGEARRLEYWLKSLKRRDYIENIVQQGSLKRYGRGSDAPVSMH